MNAYSVKENLKTSINGHLILINTQWNGNMFAIFVKRYLIVSLKYINIKSSIIQTLNALDVE
jgi:hypothetical protein